MDPIGAHDEQRVTQGGEVRNDVARRWNTNRAQARDDRMYGLVAACGPRA